MLESSLTDKMVDHLNKQDFVVRDTQGNKVLVEGNEAFFALMAQDMLSIAEKFNKEIDEVHKLFF